MAAKKPQDHKSKRHPKSELYIFEGDDVTIEIPYLENAPMDIMLDAQDKADSEGEMMQIVMAGLLGDEWRTQVGKLTFGEFQDLFQGWQDESAVTLGESSAS